MKTSAKEYDTHDPKADVLIEKLVAHLGLDATREIVREILTSAVKLGKESDNIADLKLVNTALKELRYSIKTFAPYREIRKVIIFGSARSGPKSAEYKMAVDLARKMSRKGFMIVTGGGPGVMEAGNRGAPEGKDFALNIRLPFEQHPNPYVSHESLLINYKYFFTRKLFFIKETDATTVFPGGFGTLDEGFEMLTLVQTGKSKPRPIVLMEPEGSSYWHDCQKFIDKQLSKNSYISACDSHLYTIATSVTDAVKYIDEFYRVYHSMRYDAGLTILRLNRTLSEATLKFINRKFRDIIIDGEFLPAMPTPHEVHDNEFLHLPRLAFNFNRHDFGRLHELIRKINKD